MTQMYVNMNDMSRLLRRATAGEVSVDPYVLTDLGKQFVHYTMNEVVTKLKGN